ncbi:MAG: protein kinase family protein [Pyrinomonadaceae bacterium]
MPKRKKEQDPYLHLTIDGYRLEKKVGQGGIGSVYKAVDPATGDTFACKIIPDEGLNRGWWKELEKLRLLRSLPNINIVQYHWHGASHDSDGDQFTYIIFDFIQGMNLKEYLKSRPELLDMAFIEKVAHTFLEVLFVCRQVKIHHGDLHEENILIKDPDTRVIDSPRTIWISDFGYGGSHNNLKPKDDTRQFFSLISSLLRRLNPADLNPRDKVMHAKLTEFLGKKVMEVDPTQGEYVGNPESLLRLFNELAQEAERESAAAVEGTELKEPGDYLVAEALGYRVEEWQNLFVPEFLAAKDLLSRNITVLTGARGCGKTMVFRRMTALMDKVIKVPSGVIGADQFVGFYLNCRDLAEAFPWLPSRINEAVDRQVIHYFHLAWFSEICKTLALYNSDPSNKFEWIDGFVSGIFVDRYHPLPKGADALAHARAFIEEEKERCRLTKLGSGHQTAWPFARLDLLDIVQHHLESHVPWIGEKPLYLFLDDYTIPIIPREVQRALNPIIFKRRSKIFFKISTEAANSFDQRGLRKKPLELFHDYDLIDLATESLHQEEKAKAALLDKIFRPRIDRHSELSGKKLGLTQVLGKTQLSNNQLANQMRENANEDYTKQRVNYSGWKVFTGMWASDIRTMIQMFTNILREASDPPKKLTLPISSVIQNKVFRSKGGEFLVFAESINDPSAWEKGPSSTKPGEPFGTHLVDIVGAFIGISRDELTKGKLVSNQGRLHPKQAFRLEILDELELTPEAIRYYHGLVRWHIFLQDWRGKSVRGMITPRLYLNRVLIPHAALTFSSHDNIHLNSKEFISLLVHPKQFRRYWNEKRKKKKQTSKQPKEPTFWETENVEDESS